MTDTAEKALVLGGGGITGIAWEIGILAGLAERGIDLTDADLVVGTSAGSVVGVDVRSGVPLADLYAAQTRPTGAGEIYARMTLPLMAKYAKAIAFTRKPQVARARVGALALRARTEPEDARRTVIESRLPVLDWPPGRLQITAVDAATGEFAVFDAASGVSLLDAVGASCAVPGIWPPVSINGRRYIDGGMRSAANVDLAAGFQRIVVIAPLTQGIGVIDSVARQAGRLAELGARVAVVKPDKAALKEIGSNVLDPARRPGAARAGYAQALAEVESVKAVWLLTIAARAERGRAGPGGRSGPAQLGGFSCPAGQTAYSSSG
jgi:NTE family protein